MLGHRPSARQRESFGERDRMVHRWRTTVSRRAWSGAVVLLTADIDYPNFKDEVARRQGAAWAGVYHDVWATLLRLQP